MFASLLTLAALAQCPGGSCPTQMPTYGYAMPYGGLPSFYQPVYAAPAVPAKRWYTLTNEPGVQGYGALNANGYVIVEARRPIPAGSR